MLNLKIVGSKIAKLRKTNGLTQDKLARLLHISPQAVSKWENGHTLPETSLLPVLSDIFGCTIDQLLMPAYTTDENLLDKCDQAIEIQAEKIAQRIIKNMEDMNMDKNIIGLKNEEIIDILSKNDPSLYSNDIKIKRKQPRKTQRSINSAIEVTATNKTYYLVEKVVFNNQREFFNIDLLVSHNLPIPYVFYLDSNRGILLTEDLSINYIQGFDFDEDTDNGDYIRSNYQSYLESIADFHAKFWDDVDAFGKIGLPWHLDNYQAEE